MKRGNGRAHSWVCTTMQTSNLNQIQPQPKTNMFSLSSKFPTNKLYNDMVQFGFHKIHGQDSTVIHTKRPHCIYNKQNHITKKLCTFDMFCRTCRFSLLNVQNNFIVKRQFAPPCETKIIAFYFAQCNDMWQPKIAPLNYLPVG
jgi:hypothetical protein